jgi:hypothetical protein
MQFAGVGAITKIIARSYAVYLDVSIILLLYFVTDVNTEINKPY